MLAWLDQLEIGRAVFIGHDLGGGVAQIAAVRAPQRCAGLVLTNAMCYESWPIPSVEALRAVAPGFARLPAEDHPHEVAVAIDGAWSTRPTTWRWRAGGSPQPTPTGTC